MIISLTEIEFIMTNRCMDQFGAETKGMLYTREHEWVLKACKEIARLAAVRATDQLNGRVDNREVQDKVVKILNGELTIAEKALNWDALCKKFSEICGPEDFWSSEVYAPTQRECAMLLVDRLIEAKEEDALEGDDSRNEAVALRTMLLAAVNIERQGSAMNVVSQELQKGFRELIADNEGEMALARAACVEI